MKLIRRQKIWLAVVIVVNLALWLTPSDVVEQIARDRHTMLGRYSRTHFSWIVGVAAISLVSFYVDWSTGATYKRRWFQVSATLLLLVPLLGAVDFLLRTPETAHYVRDSLAYHRPAGAEFHATFEDRPQAYRTYPHAPAGYGTVTCTLRTDTRGFRNQTNRERYDVVVLGDSFAEGSRVSDQEAWPVGLAKKSGLSVYNLGMSGYDPPHYLESLKEYGLALRPRYVLCMLYEGNDVRSASSDRKRQSPGLSKRLETYLKQSPIIGALDNLLIETFGPVNCDGPVKGIEMLDWLPLAIPEGPDAKYYTFAPKQLRDLYKTREGFSRDRRWLNVRRLIAQMNDLCRDAGCRLVLIYAPTKAHVMLPIVADRLPAEKVRSFTAISYKKDLPEPTTFLANLLKSLDACESVVGEWCRHESIPFVSATRPLQRAAAGGKQVYYTYDQHWTPVGHEVVAVAVHQFLDGKILTDQISTATARERPGLSTATAGWPTFSKAGWPTFSKVGARFGMGNRAPTSKGTVGLVAAAEWRWMPSARLAPVDQLALVILSLTPKQFVSAPTPQLGQYTEAFARACYPGISQSGLSTPSPLGLTADLRQFPHG